MVRNAENMTVSQKVDLLFSKIENAVESSFENLKDKKDKNKRKVPKRIKKLFIAKSKISKSIL